MERLLLYRRKLLLELHHKNTRDIWIRDINRNRRAQGDFHNLVEELRLKDIDGFFNYFRMSPENFEYLLSIVGPDLVKADTNFRDCISSKEKLAITLRYLASGDSMTSVAYSYRVGVSTVSKTVRETCESMWENLQPLFLPVPTSEVWERNQRLFFNEWNFPNCAGAIDGKHIIIQSPQKSGSLYFNYKKTFSIVLLAVADATYCYSYVDIGAYGKNSDGSIFSSSQFCKNLEDGSLQLPPDKVLPGTNIFMPATFVADEAFPLRRNILRPYPGAHLPFGQRVFNYRLSRARRMVENVFGITASRWRILRKPIIASPETATAIAKAVVCLHNFVSQAEERSAVCQRYYMTNSLVDSDVDGTFRPGDWRADGIGTGLQNIRRLSSHTYARDAANLREKMNAYFLSDSGSLAYQTEIVTRGRIYGQFPM